MSFSSGFEEGWGPTPKSADLVKDAIRKEDILKEIAASQDDLRTLLARVQTIQKECDKMTSNNETLQMYIDNLTKQMAQSRR